MVMAETADGTDQPGISTVTWLKVLGFFLASAAFMAFMAGFLPVSPPERMADAEPLVVTLIFGLGGAVAFYLGWQRWTDVQLALETPTSKVRSLAVGPVEVKGEARPVDEPLRSPLTGRDVCIYKLDVKGGYGTGDEGGGMDERNKVKGHVPFEVDDGTGAVRVEPGEAHIRLEPDAETKISEGEDAPRDVKDWFATDAHKEGDGSFSDWPDEAVKDVEEEIASSLEEYDRASRTYEESVVEAGETVYVLGGAYPQEGADHAENPEDLVVRDHDGTGKLVVSDRSESGFAEEAVVTAAAGISIGAAFMFLGIFFILKAMGLA